jgi:hypothetical protein
LRRDTPRKIAPDDVEKSREAASPKSEGFPDSMNKKYAKPRKVSL